MKRLLMVVVFALTTPAMAQITCGFTSTSTCTSGSFSNPSGSNNFATYSGGVITLTPLNCDHCAMNLWYNTLQNIQNFNTTFVFTPNDSAGIAFAIQNVTLTNNGNVGLSMSAGASGEMALSQFDTTGGPNNIWFIKFDRYYSNLTQIYLQEQCVSQSPGANCNNTLPPALINAPLPVQISLSPVNLASNAPYTATITYDGYNVCMTLTDSAGTPNVFGPHCWKVNIPGIVGGNTAYVGFGSSTGTANTVSTTTLNSWTYASGSNAIKSTRASSSFAGKMN